MVAANYLIYKLVFVSIFYPCTNKLSTQAKLIQNTQDGGRGVDTAEKIGTCSEHAEPSIIPNRKTSAAWMVSSKGIKKKRTSSVDE